MAFSSFFGRRPDCHCERLQSEKDILVEELSKAVNHIALLESMVFDLDRKLDDIRYVLPTTVSRQALIGKLSNISLPEESNPSQHITYEEAELEANDEWDMAAIQAATTGGTPDCQNAAAAPSSLTRALETEQEVGGVQFDRDLRPLQSDCSGLWLRSGDTHDPPNSQHHFPLLHSSSVPAVPCNEVEPGLAVQRDPTPQNTNLTPLITHSDSEILTDRSECQTGEPCVRTDIVPELSSGSDQLADTARELQISKSLAGVTRYFAHITTNTETWPSSRVEGERHLSGTTSSTLAVDELSISGQTKANLIRVRLHHERQQHVHEKLVLNNALTTAVRTNKGLTDALESLRAEKEQMEELFFTARDQAKQAECAQKLLQLELYTLRPPSGTLSEVSSSDQPPKHHESLWQQAGLFRFRERPSVEGQQEKPLDARKRLKKLVQPQRLKHHMGKKNAARGIVILI